jgi:hypothetical protein
VLIFCRTYDETDEFLRKNIADNKPMDRPLRENAPGRADFVPELRAGCEKMDVCEGRRPRALPLRAGVGSPKSQAARAQAARDRQLCRQL